MFINMVVNTATTILFLQCTMYLTQWATTFCINGAEMDSVSTATLTQWCFQQQEHHNIWHSHSSGAEVSSLLGCQTLSMGKFPTYWRVITCATLRSSDPRRMILKMN